jgi:polyphenol oxidase
VADCVPLLLHDPVKGVVAALHAGWQGTVGNIAGKGVEAMASMFGSNPKEIRAAIGPSISQCCYEVDAPVRDAFKKAGAAWDLYARESGAGKWQLDLAAANRQQLIDAGLSSGQIESEPLCVCCNQELFFSYRRDGGDTGRQVGFIMLGEQQ